MFKALWRQQYGWQLSAHPFFSCCLCSDLHSMANIPAWMFQWDKGSRRHKSDSHNLISLSSYLNLADFFCFFINLMEIPASLCVFFLLFSPLSSFFFSFMVWLPSWGWFIWTVRPSLWESRHHHNGMVSTLTCTQAWKHECTHKQNIMPPYAWTHIQSHTEIGREGKYNATHDRGGGRNLKETVGFYLRRPVYECSACVSQNECQYAVFFLNSEHFVESFIFRLPFFSAVKYISLITLSL